MMITACKICEKVIPVPQLGDDWWCPDCQKYSISCLSNGFPESETIRVGNYFLVYMTAYREASVVSVDENKKILRNIPINEITHEIALQWVTKLKTYVLFQ